MAQLGSMHATLVAGVKLPGSDPGEVVLLQALFSEKMGHKSE